jgi:hypothetical protein
MHMAFKRFLVCLMATCFMALGFQTASAGVIGTADYLDSSLRSERIGQIQSALARADVRGELVRLGVDPAAASERVASLSDAELASVAGQIEQLPAGGDSFFAVVGIVFVVLLILEITGVTDIFKRI